MASKPWPKRRRPRFVKALYSRLKIPHVHDFEYPWENYRRCRKCNHRQWYWVCQRQWRRGAPGETIGVFTLGLRPQLISRTYGNQARQISEMYLQQDRVGYIHQRVSAITAKKWARAIAGEND